MIQRISVLTLVLAGLIIPLSSCKSYKQVTQSREEFFSNKEVLDAFPNYNVYIHDNNNTYLLQDPKMENQVITGTPVQLTSIQEIQTIKEPASSRDKRKHKYDLNIYTTKDISSGTTADVEKNIPAPPFELRKEEIKKVSVYADDKEGNASTLAVILIIFGALIVAVLLVYLLVLALSESASQGSNNSSGGGGSGSNSNSGNSGSGGSGSNSGCYIATMVYGDYDAPEVMVLRKFRDEKLDKTIAGRAFIRFYYHYSPWFVERLKNKQLINMAIRNILDKIVRHLSR